MTVESSGAPQMYCSFHLKLLKRLLENPLFHARPKPARSSAYFRLLSELRTPSIHFDVRCDVRNMLIRMPASHGDISVDLQGSLTAQKRACMLLSIYYLMVISCNTFGVATSPNVTDLSTSFNGMNLNMWSCPSSSFGIVFVGFPEH